MLKNRRNGKRALAVAAMLAPVAALLPTTAAVAEDEVFADPDQAAASWLGNQSDGDYWNYGGQASESASLDGVIGLLAANVGAEQAENTLNWLSDPDVLDGFIYTGAESGEDEELKTGQIGKLIYVIETSGGDATQFAERDLTEELEESLTDDGLYGESGDVLATGWAVLGLDRAGAELDDSTAAAIADLQCPDGGFSWESGEECASSADYTGVMVSALSVLGGDDAENALTDAEQWLLDNQDEDGAFTDGSTANANSTAMAAQALLATGNAEEAERAVSYLLTLQIPCGDDAQGAIKFQAEEDPDWGEDARIMATGQALVPLAGQNLAELDASDAASDVPGIDCEPEEAVSDSDSSSDSDNGWLPWIIVAVAVVIAAMAAFLVIRAKRAKGSE